MNLKQRNILIPACLTACLFTPFSHALDVTIQLHNYRHIDAKVYIAIYRGVPGGSWKDTPAQKITGKLTAEPPMWLYTRLPSGPYAARAYIDLNNNGLLDLDRKGKPLEPFAISSKTGRATLNFSRALIQIDTRNPELSLVFFHPKSSLSAAADDD